MPAGELTTGVDQLKALIERENKISVKDAAKRLHVSNQTIEDWASLLEESGEIKLEYHLASTYIIKNVIIPKEQQKNANALILEKREFQDRTGGIINFMDRLEDEIKELQRVLNETIHTKLGKDDLRRLKSAESEHKQTDAQMIDAKHGLLNQMTKIEGQVRDENTKVTSLLTQLAKDLTTTDQLLDLEDREAEMLERNEKLLENKLSAVGKLLDKRLVGIIRNKLPLHARSKEQLGKLKLRATEFKAELARLRKDYDNLKNESAQRHSAVQKVHQQIIAKLKRAPSNLQGKSVVQVKRFFSRRAEIAKFLTAIANEERSLKYAAQRLLGQGDNLSITNQAKFEAELARLSKDLKVVSDRRGALEVQIKKLIERLA